jgi:hypothetical protein
MLLPVPSRSNYLLVVFSLFMAEPSIGVITTKFRSS